MSDAMKRCPFCGSTNVDVVDGGGNKFWVTCFTCLSCGPESGSEEIAVQKWNMARRVDLDAPGGAPGLQSDSSSAARSPDEGGA